MLGESCPFMESTTVWMESELVQSDICGCAMNSKKTRKSCALEEVSRSLETRMLREVSPLFLSSTVGLNTTK